MSDYTDWDRDYERNADVWFEDDLDLEEVDEDEDYLFLELERAWQE